MQADTDVSQEARTRTRVRAEPSRRARRPLAYLGRDRASGYGAVTCTRNVVALLRSCDAQCQQKRSGRSTYAAFTAYTLL